MIGPISFFTTTATTATDVVQDALLDYTDYDVLSRKARAAGGSCSWNTNTCFVIESDRRSCIMPTSFCFFVYCITLLGVLVFGMIRQK